MNDSARNGLENNDVYEFDEYSFDRKRCLLSREGFRVPCNRKVMETLACLLEGAPNAVSKSELMAKVWPGVVIEETGLHRNISLLRKLLSSQTGKQYVETIPKVGYRFVGDVKSSASNEIRGTTESQGAESDTTGESGSDRVHVAMARTAQGRLRRGASFLILTAVLGTVVACYSLQPASKRESIRLVPLTTHSQERPVVAAAINAEGTEVVYAERDALFVKGVNESNATELSLPQDLMPSYVRWMPGNRSIVVSATDRKNDETSIWLVPLSAGSPRQIIRNGALATSSPAGDRIAFVRSSAEIWIADTHDGRERRLAIAPGNYRFVYPPQFTADGKFIVDGFYKPADPHTTIEARRAGDGEVVTSIKLPRLQAFTLLGQDALLLSVFSSRGIPPVEIAIQPFDSERGLLGPMRKIAEWTDATAYKLTASQDARRVVLIRDRTQSDVYLADVAPETHAMLNVRRLTFDEASDFPWAWTVDSKKVLFHSLRTETFHVYEQAFDKTTAHDVVGNGRDSKWPLMSFDGRWLFYFSQKYPYAAGPDSLTLMRQRVGTLEPAKVVASFTHDDVGLRCAMRQDRCVIIDQASGISTVSELMSDTGVVVHLFDVPLVGRHYQQWSLSPDGRRLALLNDSGIHVYSLANGSLEREIRVAGTCALRAVTWDSEGQGFFVSKTAGELGQITHVTEAGVESSLFTGPMSAGGWVVPSPDGNHLAFQQWVPSANAWMLELNPTATRAQQAAEKIADLRL